MRRPRWQHMCQKAKNRKTQKVWRETWEEDVENMVKSAKTADGTPESFVDHILIPEKTRLKSVATVLHLFNRKSLPHSTLPEFNLQNQENSR